jgi:hypothetical protein
LQGFSREIPLSPEVYVGYVKDYDGADLMACELVPDMQYADLGGMLKVQRQRLREIAAARSGSVTTHPPLDFEKASSYPPEYIPGVLEAGWRPADNYVAGVVVLPRTHDGHLPLTLKRLLRHELQRVFARGVDGSACSSCGVAFS